jgi:hypothetical protein
MTITNNDIPPFAEEKTLYSEQNNLEQILSQFKQPIPSSFIELKQLN